MKKLVIIICTLILWTPNVQALCFLTDVECIAPFVLPSYGNNIREWSSSQGSMYASNNVIFGKFRFDAVSVSILRSNSSFGLEIEAVLFGENRNKVELDYITSTFPKEAEVGRDTEVCDYVTNDSETKVFAIHILNPAVLKEGVDYFVFFYLKDRLPSGGIDIKPGLQLTIDMNYLPLIPDLIVESIPSIDQFQYYALETDHYEKFTAYPDQYNGTCWFSKVSSHNCDLMSDYKISPKNIETDGLTFNNIPKEQEVYSSNSGNSNGDSGFTCDNVTDGFQASIGSRGGQCVPYVRYETGIEYNCCNTAARLCYDQAYDCGYDVGSKPELGSIAVFNSWKGNPYGHVGIVIGIDAKNSKIKLRHSNWRLNEKVSEDWVSTKALPLKGYVYCDGDNLGSGGSTLPTEPPASGRLPDFITNKVTMGSKDGRHEKYTWKINETAYVHAWIDNIGDADWEGKAKEIKVPFYLSKGTKEDSHSDWIRVGRETIKKEHIKVKDKPKHEYIKFDLLDWANEGKVLPGRTYNFVVCADRPKDEDNGDGDVKEKHKSNNCSTEAVFYVDFGPPRNVDLTTRMLALTNGKTSLRAGENYGLQVEISNIGTEPPWNGFRTSYEIKGPGTGDQWQIITDDGSDANQLYAGAVQTEHITDGFGAKAPMVGGDYLFRACADYTKAVPETDESNNCTELAVYIAPPPMPDLITHSLRLTSGRTELYGGELYGLEVGIQNIGEVRPGSGFRTQYEIKGPGTGDVWQFVADDGSDADELAPGATHWEHITDGHGAHIPNVAGTYTARACADYQNKVAESDEENNCTETTFEVIVPECVLLNPMEGLPTTGDFDMEARSIQFPDTIKRGDEMHPKVTNCTVSGSSPATQAMWAYARCDGTGFTEFERDRDEGMNAGECRTEEIITDEHSANMEPGIYVMYFISNGTTQIPESDYSNNVQAKVFRVE